MKEKSQLIPETGYSNLLRRDGHVELGDDGGGIGLVLVDQGRDFRLLFLFMRLRHLQGAMAKLKWSEQISAGLQTIRLQMFRPLMRNPYPLLPTYPYACCSYQPFPGLRGHYSLQTSED